MSLIPRENPIPALMDFVRSWVPDLRSEHRLPSSEIPSFVPPPLRSIYELTGNWPVPYNRQWRPPDWIPGLFGTQDRLLPIDQLQVQGERFTFLRENQCVWSCETVLGKEDPPVFSNSLAYTTGNDEMREVCASLRHFLTTFCLQELAFGSRHLFCVDSDSKSPEEIVTKDLESVWLKGFYVMDSPSHSFHLCDRRAIVMCTWGDYWIACNDDSALELINDSDHEIRRIHGPPEGSG